MNVFISRKFLAVDICSLPRVTGLCYALFYRFGYSPVTKECVPFVYGGCGGNANRFDSIQACESACKGK